MKKTLAALLSILLPAAATPVTTFAAGKPLKDFLNPQEKALWNLPATNEDGKCALEAEVDEAQVTECRSRLGKAVDAYLAQSSLPEDGWSAQEAAYVAHHPDFSGNSGYAALGALFTEGKLTGCEGAEDRTTLMRRMRQLLRKDLLSYREGSSQDVFASLIKTDFAGGKVTDCATALGAAANKHLALKRAIIDKFNPLENAILKDLYRTPKAEQEFVDSAHAAALGTTADQRAFYKKYREVAREYASKANSLPRINGNADTVMGMLSSADEAFLANAVGEKTRAAMLAKIADADALAKTGDKKAAKELAQRIRTVVAASLSSYAASTADVDAKDQLKKIDEISDIALNPGNSLEQSIALIQKKFDGTRIENEVVLMPGETEPGHKPNVTVGEGELARRRDKTDVPAPERVSEVQANKTLDTGDEKGAAEAKTKARLFKRALLGAAWGAVGLGFFGFIFGGPIGALVAAAAGAAIMGGVVHMVNKPIE